MPDLSASTNSLGNSADATEPRAIEADDEDLQTVAEQRRLRKSEQPG